jgi:predicted RND superfamily exporter protein
MNRWRWAILLVAAVLGVLGVARLHVETSLSSFLPASDPALTQYDRLAGQFGGDPLVVLVRSDQDLGMFQSNELLHLLQAEGQLSKVAGVKTVYGPATMLNQIAGQAQHLILELMGRRDALIAQAKALAKAQGASTRQIAAAGAAAQAKFDARYGPVIVAGMPAGLPTLLNAGFATKVVFGQDGTPGARWRFMVPDRATVAILVRPKAGIDSHLLSRIVGSAERIAVTLNSKHVHAQVTGSPALIAAMSTQVQDEGPWLALGALLAVALCYLIGARSLSRSRRWMPVALTCESAVVALGIWGWTGRPATLGVVAFAPIVLGIGAYYPTYFALGAAPRTVVTVALATASGLGTMMFSPLPVVRDLGAMLTLGVLSAVVLAAVARPILVDSSPPLRVDTAPPERSARSVTAIRWAAAGLAVAAVVGWILFPSISLRTDVNHFAGGVPALAAATQAEGILGSSGEVDLMLSGPDVTTPAALAWQGSAGDAIALQVGDSMRAAASLSSILNFLGAAPTKTEIAAAIRLMPPYLLSSVLNSRHTQVLTAFGVRVDDLGTLASTLKEASSVVPPPPAGYQQSFVGLPVVLIRASELVASHRIIANVLGIAAPLLIFAIGLRRRRDVLRAAIAAVAATGLGFLLVSLTGGSLDPLTVGLGALTSGIACEFTVVYSEAVESGDRRLRGAIGLVAGASLVGYAVLMLSGLDVIRGFGTLLAGSIALAAVASVVTVEATRSGRFRESAMKVETGTDTRVLEEVS